jgi:Family of unknown function (DUF5701)
MTAAVETRSVGVVPGIPAAEAIASLGFTTMDAEDLAGFVPIEGIDIPSGPYVLAGVDTGRAFLNVTPDHALSRILAAGRSPLTIEEGIALLAEHPDVLRTHNAFSLLGSRCGDRRVPALWLSKGRARLGWCWAGNPHTWLGSASCAERVSLTDSAARSAALHELERREAADLGEAHVRRRPPSAQRSRARPPV